MKIDEAVQGCQDLPLTPRESFILWKLLPPYDKLVSHDSSISLCDLRGPLCLCGEHPCV